MATTLFELDTPRIPVASRVLPGIGRLLGDAVHAIQYARLLQGMSQVSDEQMKLAGLSRAEFLRRAHVSIYGDRG